MQVPSKEELKRKALLIPCESKEDLHRWIRVYLDIDLPDEIVDPTSNSSPMDTMWSIYEAMLTKNPERSRFLFYAARDSYKTLGSAIVELLAILHFERDVAHMAAIESQSVVCSRYVNQFSLLPYIRDYATKVSERRAEYTRYKSGSGEVISPIEYEELPDSDKSLFAPTTNFVQVVIATTKGSNSLHAQMMVLDELDLAPRIPVEEAKMIPSQCRDGSPPVIAMTSSRKYGHSLVQEEIDEAEARGTIVLHWNLIDVAKRCPENRHLPSEPKIDIYVNDETLKAISEEEYSKLPVENKEKFVKRSGYAGCIKNCRLFAVCQGRLATRKDSKSRFLKSLPHVQNMFRAVIPEVAKAQLLCQKPSSYGLIYPYFEPDIHCLSAAQMAAKITGEEYPDSFTKADLVELAKSRGCQFYSGMDHGFTHNFAVVTGFKDGNRMYVIDTIAAPELELSQKIEVCNDRIKDLDPIVYADPEDPASNKTLKKHFRLKEWSKKPGSVVSGIQVVRYKLNPTMGEPELFLLRGDNGCEILKSRVTKYHWTLDKVTGKPTDVPDETEDDECDALRYLVMNVFDVKGKTVVSDPPPAQQPAAASSQYTQENWAQKIIEEQLGESSSEESVGTSRGKKGSFLWDL